MQCRKDRRRSATPCAAERRAPRFVRGRILHWLSRGACDAEHRPDTSRDDFAAPHPCPEFLASPTARRDTRLASSMSDELERRRLMNRSVLLIPVLLLPLLDGCSDDGAAPPVAAATFAATSTP